MKIKEIEHRTIIVLTTEDGTEYTRHSEDCWMQSYGMSEECVQDTTEIEAAYQDFIKPTEEDIQFKLMGEHLDRSCALSSELVKFFDDKAKNFDKEMEQYSHLPDKEYRKIEKQVIKNFDKIEQDFIAQNQEANRKLDEEFMARGYNPRMSVSEFSKLMGD